MKVSSMTKYKVVLKEPKKVDQYLSCHSTVRKDKRDANSVYVHVNQQFYGDLWSFEPVKDKPCTYKIKVAADHPAFLGDVGEYLGAHRACKRDIRDSQSTFVHAHKVYYGDEWTLIPVPSKGENAFKIILSKTLDKNVDKPVGVVLCAHRRYSNDKRTAKATYVDVHGTIKDVENDHYWKLIPKPDSKL